MYSEARVARPEPRVDPYFDIWVTS
jgi:hypothetical protein